EGDQVIIDEDDLSAIVTRRLYAVILRVRTGHEVAGQNQPPRGARVHISFGFPIKRFRFAAS
ncbi:MAG TPA: hypothetical protein VFL79_11895, partial [Terriglobia bacterium]|nr:hypothetical protein [Terriglobia bacterium]